MIARLLETQLEKSKKSVLLLGPRQVGKSTLMEKLLPDLTINLIKKNEYLAFSQNTEELEARIRSKNPKLILIDEIQRIPDLLNTIQDLLDHNKGAYRFLLTGSSARKLRRGHANLLPGRIFTYRLGPITCLELSGKIDTQKALQFGTLPEPYLSDDRDFSMKLLRSYSATYLQEEILVETMLRDIPGFSRFLAVVADNSGKFLDFTKLANRAKVSRGAARRYYEILEDTLLCDRLEPYDHEDLDLVRHPKFYLFDVGVLNGCLENFVSSGDRKGHLFEHLFFNQLKNISYALDIPLKINHFRTRGGLEIDFIITLGDRILAIELKVSDPAPSELTPLKLASSYFSRPLEKYVATINGHPKKYGDIEILPWQALLQKIFKPWDG
jgi:predicted AAA+ superfamily ATPase